MNIKINEIEQKKTKSGSDMWKITSNDGVYSVFSKEIADDLLKNIGNSVEVEIHESGNYKNIVDFIKSNGKSTEKNTFELASENKLKSIATGYAEQCYLAEISALVPKTLDLKEALSLIEDRKKLIWENARAFHQMIMGL